MTISPLPIIDKPHLQLSLNPSSSHTDKMMETVEQWRTALNNYELALRTIRPNGSQNPDVLRSLDNILYNDLPIAISSRTPHYITAVEYTMIVEWKLRRGTWRNQTLHFARIASDDDVRTASTKAFKHLETGKIGEAFDALVPLLGGSPAVASAILSVRDTSVPFMSRELLQDMQGNISFFRSTFLEVTEKVRAKARYLSRGDVTRTWTSADVEKALYAEARISRAFATEAPNSDIIAHLTDDPQSSRVVEEDIADQGKFNESAAIPGAPNTAPETEANLVAGAGGRVSQFCRRKKRFSVKERPANKEAVEILTGQIDMDEMEQSDEVDDASRDPSYVPESKRSKSDLARVEGKSFQERVNGVVRIVPSQPSAGRTTHDGYL